MAILWLVNDESKPGLLPNSSRSFAYSRHRYLGRAVPQWMAELGNNWASKTSLAEQTHIVCVNQCKLCRLNWKHRRVCWMRSCAAAATVCEYRNLIDFKTETGQSLVESGFKLLIAWGKLGSPPIFTGLDFTLWKMASNCATQRSLTRSPNILYRIIGNRASLSSFLNTTNRFMWNPRRRRILSFRRIKISENIFVYWKFVLTVASSCLYKRRR